MNREIKEIAARIREMRELSGKTVEQVSDGTGIALTEYTHYENGIADIPASALLALAHYFTIDISVLLTGEDPRLKVYTVSRNGQGVAVERRAAYQYSHLAANFTHKKAEPFLVTVQPKPDGTVIETNSHPGQEFNYVVEGTLKILINNNEVILKEGDSIYFDSNYPHAMQAVGNSAARFIAIVL